MRMNISKAIGSMKRYTDSVRQLHSAWNQSPETIGGVWSGALEGATVLQG